MTEKDIISRIEIATISLTKVTLKSGIILIGNFNPCNDFWEQREKGVYRFIEKEKMGEVLKRSVTGNTEIKDLTILIKLSEIESVD